MHTLLSRSISSQYKSYQFTNYSDLFLFHIISIEPVLLRVLYLLFHFLSFFYAYHQKLCHYCLVCSYDVLYYFSLYHAISNLHSAALCTNAAVKIFFFYHSYVLLFFSPTCIPDMVFQLLIQIFIYPKNQIYTTFIFVLILSLSFLIMLNMVFSCIYVKLIFFFFSTTFFHFVK